MIDVAKTSPEEVKRILDEAYERAKKRCRFEAHPLAGMNKRRKIIPNPLTTENE